MTNFGTMFKSSTQKNLRLRTPPTSLHLLHTSIFASRLTTEEDFLRSSTNKRDDFTFPIVNFPFLCGNIPAAPAYGVYISQLIRYSRACDVYHDFLSRARLLTNKLLTQGFVATRLKSSLLKFFGRHHELVNRYETAVAKMQSDLFLS